MASWDDIPIDSAAAFETAKEEGLDVHVADDYTLQLDCDTQEAVDQYDQYEGRLHAHFGIVKVARTKSRNGNTHIYVRLQKMLPVAERIALQAALGSGPTREMLSLKRHLDCDSHPILLFEKKGTVTL